VGRLHRAALKKCRDISRSSIIEAPTSQVKPAEVFALRIRPSIAAVAALASIYLPLLAQETNCAVDPHNSACAFDSTDHLLHVIAIILAVVLAVIIAAAVIAYRKAEKKKLTPDD
jgi:hypothetical protein